MRARLRRSESIEKAAVSESKETLLLLLYIGTHTFVIRIRDLWKVLVIAETDFLHRLACRRQQH